MNESLFENFGAVIAATSPCQKNIITWKYKII